MRIATVAILFCLLITSFSVFADNQRPSVVNNVRAQSAPGPTIIVSWNQPWDNTGVDGYNIYRDGSYMTTVRGTTNYIDQRVVGNREYRYAVVAFDRARNFSVLSSSASATSQGARATSGNANSTPPPTASGTPSAPSNLRADVRNSTSAVLSWSAPSGGADGYNLYKDGRYYSTVKGRNDFTATSLDANRSYSFEVAAFRNNRYSIKSGSIDVSTRGSSTNTASPPNPQAASDSRNSSIPNGYTLVFSDDFNARNINASKWNTSYRWGANWIINNEAQYYVDRLNDANFGVNPFEHDGNKLAITATRTPDRLRGKARDQRYLSGAMTTFNKFSMKYGYVEMRAKLPKGKGLWPAFWLLHESNNNRRPEIDVMEMLGDNTRLVYQTYHHYNNGNLRSTPSYQAAGPDYSSDFHTFGMLWEPGSITWYVDGEQTNRYSSGDVSNESMYLLVNLALGGNWAGNPDGNTQFPARYVIDYVRAYQKR